MLMELCIFGSLLYVCEKEADSGFHNIPISIYWCFVTITTVGYGDIYPVTSIGRILACCTMFTGLLIVASVVIIFGGNFEFSQARFEAQRIAYIKRESTFRERQNTELRKILDLND